jgi:FAD:protein FMN transferase
VLRTVCGAERALIQGGQSSLKALGAPPYEPRGWKVQIGDPFRAGKVLGAVRLKDRALGTSGTAQQFFEHNGRRYGHVLDPRTGWPAEGLASASVLAPTAAEADALSTAFFIQGVEAARQYCASRPEVGALLVTNPPSGAQPQVILINLHPNDVELRRPPERGRRTDVQIQAGGMADSGQAAGLDHVRSTS